MPSNPGGTAELGFSPRGIGCIGCSYSIRNVVGETSHGGQSCDGLTATEHAKESCTDWIALVITPGKDVQVDCPSPAEILSVLIRPDLDVTSNADAHPWIVTHWSPQP